LTRQKKTNNWPTNINKKIKPPKAWKRRIKQGGTQKKGSSERQKTNEREGTGVKKRYSSRCEKGGKTETKGQEQ